MPRMRMIYMGVALIVVSTFAADARDSQTKLPASAPRNATIYFLRPEGLITPRSPDIKVDGLVIGKLPAGAYFVVSRPPGHHTIEVQDSFLDGGWQSEVEWASSQTYFIEIGTKQGYGIGNELLAAALANVTGRQMEGRGLMAKFSFFTLDAERGRAEISKMKSTGR